MPLPVQAAELSVRGHGFQASIQAPHQAGASLVGAKQDGALDLKVLASHAPMGQDAFISHQRQVASPALQGAKKAVGAFKTAWLSTFNAHNALRIWDRAPESLKAWAMRLANFWSRITHPATPLAKPAANLAPMPANAHLPSLSYAKEAPSQVIAEQAYSLDANSAAQKELRQESKRQKGREEKGAGKVLGGRHSRDARRVREIAAWAPSEKLIPAQGLVAKAGVYSGPALRNPNDPSGRFDPYALQPHWVFDVKEDSLPVRPDFDGNGRISNDLAAYQHGSIGGDQPLAGAFSVTQRGEYTVLTYSLNYVDNKFTNYHEGDSSTASIYLKANADGKLSPAYLYTSFHYNARMVPWQDVKLDADGHPIIRVERGSHALHPYRKDEAISDDGVHVQGNGEASLNGQALPHRMQWFALQADLENTQYLDPKLPGNQVVWNRLLDGYPERRVPFHPSLFDRG